MMNTKLLALGSVALSLGIVGAAVADESLAEKSRNKTWQSTIDSNVDDLNKKCGTKIVEKTDWEGFDKVDLDHASQSGGGVSVGQYCGDAVKGVYGLCMSDDGKEAVSKKITTLVCRYGGPGKRSIVVAKGTFTFSVDFKAGSNDVDIRNDLAKKL